MSPVSVALPPSEPAEPALSLVSSDPHPLSPTAMTAAAMTAHVRLLIFAPSFPKAMASRVAWLAAPCDTRSLRAPQLPRQHQHRRSSHDDVVAQRAHAQGHV